MLAVSDNSRPAAPPYHPLVLAVCALAAGIALDRWSPLAAGTWWAVAVAAITAWSLLWAAKRDDIASCILLLGIAAAGGAWHHDRWRIFRADEIGRMVQEDARPFCVEAIALQSPRWVPAPPPTPLRTIPQGEQSELLVWLTAVRDGRTLRSASGWASLDVGGPL